MHHLQLRQESHPENTELNADAEKRNKGKENEKREGGSETRKLSLQTL